MRTLLTLLCLMFAMAAPAFAQTKPGLVLLPIQGTGMSAIDKDQYRAALAKSLSEKYEVFSGDEVDKKLEKFAKKTCDAEKCLQEMAIAYQASLIARGIIAKEPDGYLITVEIRDIFSDKVELSDTKGCAGCGKIGLIEALKALAATAAPAVVAAPPVVVAAPQKATRPAPQDDQTALWEAVQQGNTADDYAAYLGQYPKGKFVALAKSRLAKLKQDAEQATKQAADEARQAQQQAEQDAWKAAEANPTPESYGAYLNAYPTGKFAQLATARQKKLAEDKTAKEEQTQWQSAERSGQQSEVEAYLKRYPSGRFSAPARTKLAALVKEAAEMRPGKVVKDCADCPEVVMLPAGRFEMGSNEAENEKPVHTVILPAFFMGKTEVTRGQFAAFIRDSGYNAGDQCWQWNGSEWKEKSGNWRDPGYPQDDSHPVACVNWNDAQAYVDWLGKKTGKAYRLPSEAEWEYAARGGSTTARPWGNDADQACANANVADQTMKNQVPGWKYAVHNCNDGQAYTAPVGRYKPNAFGLNDMIGNVYEWTQDCWNESYAGAPSDGKAWMGGDCGRRVLRGGSWLSKPQLARSANRLWGTSGNRNLSGGFRVAAPFARTLP